MLREGTEELSALHQAERVASQVVMPLTGH